jgi:hypothetical protein
MSIASGAPTAVSNQFSQEIRGRAWKTVWREVALRMPKSDLDGRKKIIEVLQESFEDENGIVAARQYAGK